MKQSIDEAFMPVQEMVSIFLQPFEGFRDEEHGVAMGIEKLSMDIPIQLEVVTNEDRSVAIGATPPLYKLDTSFSPVFHQLRFTIESIE